MQFFLSFLMIFFVTSCSTKKIIRTISSEKSPAEVNCEDWTQYGKGSLQKCSLKSSEVSKDFYIFKGEGSAKEIQYAHGFLLAEQIEKGSIEEMLELFKKEEERMAKSKWLFKALMECHMKRLKKSVSPEFLENVSALADGYRAAMKAKGLTAKYSEDDFILSLLGIEVGNVLGGLAYQQTTSTVSAVGKLIGTCGINVAKEGVKQLISKLRKIPPHDRKMGCVGFIAPDSATGDGLIHGRNLDQGPLMKSWAKAPVIFMIKETGHIPFVAAGTAGLVYPGGISGFNEHGIAVSLHQMNTTRWDTKHRAGSAEVVPYLQQRVLREAKSIDEAYALIKKTNVFSSWTIFISDSKTQEAASIEVSAKRKTIARRTKNELMAQSNHYIDPSMQKEHFHGNFAAYLETQSRLHQMEKSLEKDKGLIDIDWGMDTLSSHIDYFEGERSFGRTAVKLSNIMSSMAYPRHKEFWMTVGDKKPAAHSWYVGVKVDFSNESLDVIRLNRSSKMESRKNLEKSYSFAVLAYIKFKEHDYKSAIENLKIALSLAKDERIEDTSFTYNLARLYMMEKDMIAAKEYMDKLLMRKSEFHPYHQALISMYSAQLLQVEGHKEEHFLPLYREASDILGKFLNASRKNTVIKKPNPATAELEEARFEHGAPNLKKKLKLIKNWIAGKDKKIPDLDFSVND